MWANVDHEADFGAGFAFCPSDCLQTPDGLIGIQDMLAMLAQWGGEAGGGPCDANFDGVIDLIDFVELMGAWGPCEEVPSSAPPPGAPPLSALATRSPDIDGNGLVDADDLATLSAAWGSCGECPADLDGDGRVGARDMMALLRDWGTVAEPDSLLSRR